MQQQKESLYLYLSNNLQTVQHHLEIKVVMVEIWMLLLSTLRELLQKAKITTLMKNGMVNVDIILHWALLRFLISKTYLQMILMRLKQLLQLDLFLLQQKLIKIASSSMVEEYLMIQLVEQILIMEFWLLDMHQTIGLLKILGDLIGVIMDTS